MKSKKVLFFIFLFPFFNCLTAQNFDFRKTNWGMDSMLVKKAEISKLAYSKKKTMVYMGKIGDLDAKIIYNFNSSNQLYRGIYNIAFNNNTTKNPSNAINNYLMFQELLTNKYGDPINKKSATINGKEIKQEEWASNIVSDNLTLETKWELPQTEITLTLYSINDELYLEIIYTSLEKEIKENEKYKMEVIKEL